MAFTFFFRDAETLELAIAQMPPASQGQDRIEIWDAGCAHGPEPYTLAILLREKMPDALFRKVRIHATDVEGDFAAQVAEGIYPESELRRLPPGILEKYFRPLGDSGKFGIVEEIRSRISFSRHDLLSLEPLVENLSLIVCKNVLLHFNEEQRCKVLRMFHAALRPDGVLVMEHTQKIPAALQGLFRPLLCHAQVFGKVPSAGEIVCRKEPPTQQRRPNFWKHVFGGKSLNERLAEVANESVCGPP
jgi:chemotaxis protein methyltransferase CheR